MTSPAPSPDYHKAFEMAKAGYGWEDIVKSGIGLSEREARIIVFGKARERK